MKSFPELRATMARYGITQQDMGKIIGDTYQTFGRKLNEKSNFSYDDMIAIAKFFVDKGEEASVDKLFFAWKFTNVNWQKVTV